MPEPNIQDTDHVHVSDSVKQCQNYNLNSVHITDNDIIPASEAITLSTDPTADVDIRPRFLDPISKSYHLLDTGAQVSVCAPSPDDKIDHTLKLEAVDGSLLPCYGTKTKSFRLGRKEYHQKFFITNTSETILGMDFVKAYRMDFRWGEWDDYYIYDTKAKTKTLLEFVKIPKNKLPRTCAIAVQHQPLLSSFATPWDFFQAFSVKAINSLSETSTIPSEYQKLINKYPQVLKADFKEVKHSVEHCIDTPENSTPIRTKVRPLLPGSPKAVAGQKAWQQMIDLGIVEKVSAEEQNYWSHALHLQTKPDQTERPCGDFRKLNELTIQDSYQLPDINHFSSHIKKSNYFSKIDISRAFHFVPIRKSDQLKTCVATPWGLFKFKRMAFG